MYKAFKDFNSACENLKLVLGSEGLKAYNEVKKKITSNGTKETRMADTPNRSRIRDFFVRGVFNEISSSNESERLDITKEVQRGLSGGTTTGRVQSETGTNHQTTSKERLKRKAETMYKYKFKFKGGGKQVNNKNFKFHCFIADSDAVEFHLFSAKQKGLVVESEDEFETYESAMPIVKVFTSTSGFGVPKEYFSFFFLINPSSTSLVTILPLGFDKADEIGLWRFTAPGRFLKKDEIRDFFGRSSESWKFYQRQSFLSKRRLLEMVKVTKNDGNLKIVEEEKKEIRMIVDD